MKNRMLTIRFSFASLLPLLAFLAFFLLSSPLWSQDDEEEGPISTRMSLSAVQGDGETLFLKALVRARIDRRYMGIPNLMVNFQDLLDTLDNDLGQIQTDENGIATLKIPRSKLTTDSTLTYSVAASFPGNDEFEDSDDDIEFIAADLKMEGVAEDSSRTVTAYLSSGGEPVADADVILFVKSMVNPLKIGEGSTDENGEVSFEFPLDLPGNPDGTIDIRAFVEDSDDYASVESWLIEDWGIARQIDSDQKPRELWSTSPPLWMFLIFIGILVFIWGHYLKVIYDLFKLRKLAHAENSGKN